MNFNYNRDKVVGIIDHELGGKSVKIKVLAILKENNTFLNSIF